MAETDLKVQVRFEATGDKELAKAFTAAANAQKKLDDATKKLAAAQKKARKQTGLFGVSFNRLTGSAGKARISFATFRSQLLLLTFAFNLADRTVGKLVRAFSEQERAVAKLNQTLRSTKFAAGVSSRELQGLASQMQRLTGIGDATILSMQGVLLTFTQIKGQVFKDATEAILNISVALGQDLQQSAIQVGKAINDPARGVAALQRIGIQFTDQQKAMIKQLDKTNQTVKAQEIILKELEIQFGGTALNVDATTIAFGRLSSAFGDLLETGGGKLEPFILGITKLTTEFVESLNETPSNQFTEFFASLNKESQKTISFQNNLGNVLDDKVLSIMKEIGFASDNLDLQKFFNESNEQRVIEFGNALRDNPNKALQMLNQQLRDIPTTEVTFFDDLIKTLETGLPGVNIEQLMTDSGAFGFDNLFGKFDDKLFEFTNDARNVSVTELRSFFNEVLADGVLTPEELTKTFNDNDFMTNIAAAMALNFGDLGDTSDMANVSPFADILDRIFGGEISFDENQATIDQINLLREAVLKYMQETGIPITDEKSFLEKLGDDLVKFKENNEDGIKAFDDLAGAAMQFSKGNKEVTISLLRLRQALAIGNTLLAFTEALKEGSIGKAFSLFAAGMTKVAQFKSQIDAARKAAIGADFVTQGKQMIMVGDNPTGRERVQVTPLGNTGGSPGGDSSVTINLNGNILGTDEFVRDTLIPEIENAVGRNLA